MMPVPTNKDIRLFVKETLGCGCPEEVFQYIDCQSGLTIGNILLRARINIGNRLLIYVAESENAESVKNMLPYLINMGKKERDSLSFNRFRLVLATDSIEEIGNIAQRLFEKIVKDEKIHMHIIRKAELRI